MSARISDTLLYWLLYIALIGMLGTGSRIPGARAYKIAPSAGIAQPGLALQVPADSGDLRPILGWNRDDVACQHDDLTCPGSATNRGVAERAQRLDFFFIPCYLFFFGLAGLLQYRDLDRPWKYLGLLAMVLVAAASFLDVRENLGILAAVAAIRKGANPATGYASFAWLKWMALFAMQVCLTPLLLDRSKGLGKNFALLRLAGLVLASWIIFSALTVFSAKVVGSRLRLEAGVSGVAGLPLFFLLYFPFHEPVWKWLSAKCQTPAVQRLANWPDLLAGQQAPKRKPEKS